MNSLKPLYPHQKDALDNIDNSFKNNINIGRIVIPTGGAKTRIEALCVEKYGILNKKSCGASLVLFHRIALGQQHVKSFLNWIPNKNWSYAEFHSGRKSNDEYSESFNSTDKRLLLNYIKVKNKENKHVIVFSTYQSFHKLTDIDFDIMIADESQFLVQNSESKDYRSLFASIKANKKLCFTATEKWTDSEKGRGLNNKHVFGPRIYEIKPHILIDRGIIVKPKIHIAKTSEVETKEKMLDFCIEIAMHQDKVFKEAIGFSKTLFAMPDSLNIKSILDNIVLLKSMLPDHDIYIIHSNPEIGMTRNGKMLNDRDQFLDEIDKSRSCLIFHYDILSEGIDISDITGVALLRTLTTCKLLQTVGRSLRTCWVDGVQIKDYALISVPIWNNCEDDLQNVYNHIKILRSGGFNFDLENDISWELVKDITDRISLSEEDSILDDLLSLEKEKIIFQEKLKDIEHLDELKLINLNAKELLNRENFSWLDLNVSG